MSKENKNDSSEEWSDDLLPRKSKLDGQEGTFMSEEKNQQNPSNQNINSKQPIGSQSQDQPQVQPSVKKKGLSTKAIVGIIIGSFCFIIAVIGILAVVILFNLRQYRSRVNDTKAKEAGYEIDTKIYKIGDEVQAGDFKYKVNSVEKVTNVERLKQIGGESYKNKYDIVYLLVNLTVTNTSQKSQKIDLDSIAAENRHSGTYPGNDNDLQNTYRKNHKEYEGFFSQIEPGVSKTGVLVFSFSKDWGGYKLIVDADFNHPEKGKKIDLGI